MKILAGIVALSIILVTMNSIPSIAQAGSSDYVVVAHKTTTGTLMPKKLLKSIYLREAKSWGKGKGDIIVVNMEGAGDFYENLFGKSYVEMQAYWLNMRIKYSVDLPVTKKTSADVKSFVASNEGAIGFIKKSDLDDSVKEIKIQE